MSKQLQDLTKKHCENPPASYNDLKVLFLNCTLNRTPVLSHTEGLIEKPKWYLNLLGLLQK